jgi:hypothetical protein
MSDNLEVLATKLADIQDTYALSREEQLAYLQIYTEQQRLLKALQTPPPAAPPKAAAKDDVAKEAASGKGAAAETKDDGNQSKVDDKK